MQGLIRCVLIAGLLIGCSGDDSHVPDTDAAVGSTGVVVDWVSKPDGSWPLELEDGFTLERATFALDNLRVVGDAGPGDPRTTANALSVVWSSDGTVPDAINFPDAPTGLYSQVSVLADGHLITDSFDLRGHVTVNGTVYDYRVEGDNPLAVTIGIDRTLMPPDVTTIKLAVDFKHALEVIDWTMVEVDTGRLEVDDGDPIMPQVRQALVASFSVDGQAGTLGVR